MSVRVKIGGSGDPYAATRFRGDDPPGPPGYRPGGRPFRPARRGGFGRKLLIFFAACGAIVALTGLGIFFYYYAQYSQVVDDRLQNPLFERTAKIYAAPRELRIGQTTTVDQIAANLRHAGYTEGGNSQLGTFHRDGDSISVQPGPQSFHAPIGAVIRTDGVTIGSIQQQDGTPLAAYQLEPALITGLSEEKTRTKRRVLTYDEMPRNLINATLAIEDRRFFQHGGINWYRAAEAMITDVRSHRYQQGASTLTMQLARGFFLTPHKDFRRKLVEAVITLQLEHRFNKQQIFELYANYVPLGQRGSFAINGFGEAAQAFFGKDVKQLDLAECATLAGMIQRPSRLSPYRHPEAAMERRNLVLDGMVETGAVTAAQADAAKAEQLHLAPGSVDAGEAPFFVDLVRERMAQQYGDRDVNNEGLSIYTSLDPDLQRVATEAVEIGMHNVDQIVAARKTGNDQRPQVALIALNPHTGQVLALVGGRSYGDSQLNHAVAKRPTGSIFKPFVYAAAFNSSLTGQHLGGSDELFSPVTILSDEQQTYMVGNQSYTPHDFHGESFGHVTARFALQKSLNRATISLGSMVGFGTVASLARDAGIKSARGTPSVAIGAYDASPLDMAGAYTVFANGGTHIDPLLLASVRDSNGEVIDDFSPVTHSVLDPRVAYLTTSLLQNVLNAGTGAVVRQMGFSAPAAGKTGTSNDAWFAGYTSNLLCIIWIGNDDYTDIKIEGAKAAAPMWAEFMKRAIQLPEYSDAKPFSAPSGVVQVSIDRNTNRLANESCPAAYSVAFLDGTQPTQTCDEAPSDGPAAGMLALGNSSPAMPEADPALAPRIVRGGQPLPEDGELSPDGVPAPPPKKKSFLRKLFGGDKDADPTGQPAPPAPQ